MDRRNTWPWAIPMPRDWGRSRTFRARTRVRTAATAPAMDTSSNSPPTSATPSDSKHALAQPSTVWSKGQELRTQLSVMTLASSLCPSVETMWVLPRSSLAAFRVQVHQEERGVPVATRPALSKSFEWLERGRASGQYILPGVDARGGTDEDANGESLPSLVQLYKDIASAAPSAQIIVVGYPELFESSAYSAGTETTTCKVGTNLGILDYTISAPDVQWLDRETNALDRLIGTSVQHRGRRWGGRFLPRRSPPVCRRWSLRFGQVRLERAHLRRSEVLAPRSGELPSQSVRAERSGVGP